MDNISVSRNLIITVPVKDEEEGIGTFLQRLAAISEKIGLYGVVIVDDGCVDKTVEAIEEIRDTLLFGIKIVRLTRNFGHQNAVSAGISVSADWAESDNVNFVGIIDADLQDRPEHFVDLMRETNENDVVYAVRKTRADGLVMNFFAPIFYTVLNKLSSIEIPRNAGTFSVFRTEIARLMQQTTDVNPYLPGLRAWIGYRQKGVELDRDDRLHGESKVGFLGLMNLSFQAFVIYSDTMINLFIALGFLIVSITAAVSTAVFFLRLFNYITIPGATTNVILILMSIGINIFFLGIVAQIANRAKINSGKQPVFLIKEIL